MINLKIKKFYEGVNKKLNFKLLPESWFTRWKSDYEDTEHTYSKWQYTITEKYKEITGNEYVWMGDWHPDIKLVHFTHAMNKPTDWI